MATGTLADTGPARYRRPGRNTVPRAPRRTRDEHATGAPGGTQCHGHPGRHGTSMPQAPPAEHMATGTRADTGRACHWYAAGTPEMRARPVAGKRPNCARCVAWSG